MRFLRLLIPLALVPAAIALNLPRFSTGPTSLRALFEQGACRPLISAERAQEKGDVGPAASMYGTVALRALRESQGVVFDRVSLRLATAGYDWWQRDRDKGWPLLVRRVMWSDDFGPLAMATEAKLIEALPPQRVFRYDLMDDSGAETLWGRRGVPVPLGLEGLLPKRMLEGLESMTYNLELSPVPGDIREAVFYKIDGKTTLGKVAWRLELEVTPPPDSTWYISVNNAVRWSPPALAPGQVRASLPLDAKGFFAVDRIIASGFPSHRQVRATLVHEYMPLTMESP